MASRSFVWGMDDLYAGEMNDSRLIGIWGTTKTPCSCWMCGNPRRHLKGKDRLTLQERKHLEAWKDFEL